MATEPVLDHVALYRASIPLAKPFRIATMVAQSAEAVFIELGWSDGIRGWGEAAPLHSINGETAGTCLAALVDLSRWLAGSTPAGCLGLLDRLMPFQHAAVAAFEMAVVDGGAQRAGLPLWRYLGGQDEGKVLDTDMTIAIVGPVEAAESAAEFVHRGFRHVKVKLGDGVKNDLARVEAVRIAVGEGVGIRVDANQAYDAMTAEQLLRGLHEYQIQFIEQPVAKGDLVGLLACHELGLVPVMADESCFSPADALALRGACWGVNVKLSKCRGLGRGREIAGVGFPSMVGGMVETRLATTAAAHLAKSHPGFQFFDLDAFHAHREDPVAGGLSLVNGEVVLPAEPGLGARLERTAGMEAVFPL